MEEEKEIEKEPELKGLAVDGLKAIRIDRDLNGTVIGIPEDTEAVLIRRGLLGIPSVTPLLELPAKEMAEIEKIERETVEEPVKPGAVAVTTEKKPPEVPTEFEEEEVPEKKRKEFGVKLGEIASAVKRKSVPAFKRAFEGLKKIGAWTAEKIKPWLGKIGLACPPEIEGYLEAEIAKERAAKTSDRFLEAVG